MKTSDVVKFWKRVKMTGTCWIWLGAKASSQYGLIIYEGRRGYAHRFSYEFHVGAIPVGQTIDHKCRNKLCVNPSHLEVVSRSENALRNPSRGILVAVIRCPNCLATFERRVGKTYKENGYSYTCCSPRCRGEFQHLAQKDSELLRRAKGSILGYKRVWPRS